MLTYLCSELDKHVDFKKNPSSNFCSQRRKTLITLEAQEENGEQEQQEVDIDELIGDRQQTLKAVLHYFFRENTCSGAHCKYDLIYHLVWIPK